MDAEVLGDVVEVGDEVEVVISTLVVDGVPSILVFSR